MEAAARDPARAAWRAVIFRYPSPEGAGRAGSLRVSSLVGMVNFVDPNVFETANAGFRPGHVRGVSPGPRGRGSRVAPAVRERRRGRAAGWQRCRGGRGTAAAAAARQPASRRPPYRRHRSAASAARATAPTLLPPGAYPDQGPRRQARRQHGARASPCPRRRPSACCPSACWRSGAAGSTRRFRAAGKHEQDLLHPPDRLRPGPGHQAASR